MKKAKRKVTAKKSASRKAPAPKKAAPKKVVRWKRTGKPVSEEHKKMSGKKLAKEIKKNPDIAGLPKKADTLLDKGPAVPDDSPKIPEGKEPWMAPVFDPQHDELQCCYCEGTIHVTETPVVLEWGHASKDAKRPKWMGRPIKKAAHYKCDREERERKGLVKRKEPKKEGEKPATGKAPVERATGTPRKRTSDSQRIFRVEKKNPRKEGSHGWNSWNVIKDGMTVAEYLAAGGRRSDLSWDVDHGWTELKD